DIPRFGWLFVSLNQTINTDQESKKKNNMLFTCQLLYFSLMSIKAATVLSKFEFFLTLIGLNHNALDFELGHQSREAAEVFLPCVKLS
ncbi:hypothetical protein Bpfe_006592, partial [Biomphalaria pfeifferi]